MSDIEEHKKMAILSGKLSDFQLNNLKMWPFVVFDNLSVASVHYDLQKDLKIKDATNDSVEHFPSVKKGVILYNLKFKDDAEIPNVEKRVTDLRNWIKTLLWGDVEVLFEKDGEKWEI